jgi:hypothetical protein
VFLKPGFGFSFSITIYLFLLMMLCLRFLRHSSLSLLSYFPFAQTDAHRSIEQEFDKFVNHNFSCKCEVMYLLSRTQFLHK